VLLQIPSDAFISDPRQRLGTEVTDPKTDVSAFPSSEAAADAVAERLEGEPGLPLQALGELTRALMAASTVEGVLQRVILAARYLIPAADVVSITLRRDDGHLYTPVETDREAVELDELQYAAGAGPCVDAAEPAGPAYAHSGDLAEETTWPAFAAGAVQHGFSSVLSTALLDNPEPSPFTGALNVYSRELDRFDVSARDIAFVLATYASLALASAQSSASAEVAIAEAQDEAANLRKALDTRTVIGQATGILMARRRLNADQAFEVLSRASQQHNVKLGQLAHILATHPDTADRI
jgi:ANTAR domain